MPAEKDPRANIHIYARPIGPVGSADGGSSMSFAQYGSLERPLASSAGRDCRGQKWEMMVRGDALDLSSARVKRRREPLEGKNMRGAASFRPVAAASVERVLLFLPLVFASASASASEALLRC